MRRTFPELAVATVLCMATTAMAAGTAAGEPRQAPAASGVPARIAPGADAAAAAQRIRALEEAVTRLAAEQQAARRALEALKAETAQPRERASDAVLLALGALIATALGAIAWLLWRTQRQRASEAWLHGTDGLADGARERIEPPVAPLRRMDEERVPPMRRLDEETVASMRPVAVRVAAAPAVAPLPPAPGDSSIGAAARLRRELTPEELIDLELQADFFIAIGQEESAIDLLMAHVRSSGGTSPLPYLKLLGIYRVRGEREAYLRIRERFNRCFNAQAPEWESDVGPGRSLEGYPAVLARVQRAWPAPMRAADLLEALLFRRDPTQAGFDLAAYEELLFLYALAKDLIAHERNPNGVDLLLPLDEPVPAPIARIEAALPTTAPSVVREVDVPLDLEAPQAPRGGAGSAPEGTVCPASPGS